MKVLIVEDEKFMADTLVRKFKEAGFTIDYLDRGEKVVAEATTKPPDIIILDILLPGKNGFEVLKELKEKDKTKNIPVIIVSNLGSREDFEKGSQLGAAGFMIKATVTPEDIIEKAKQVITGPTAGAQ